MYVKAEGVIAIGERQSKRSTCRMNPLRRFDVIATTSLVVALCVVSSFDVALAFPNSSLNAVHPRHQLAATAERRTVIQRQLSTGAASLLAGSVAGVIGIGLSFPLDTVNTRFQLVQGEQEGECGRGRKPSHVSGFSTGIVDTALQIYQNDGWQGFFAGAHGMMAGESVIKAVAFASNALALASIENSSPSTGGPSALALFVAACFAGMMAAFVVAPVERIKVVMQSSPQGMFKDEWDCARTIVHQQGVRGLLHGLDATLARDIPGYGFYFAIYGVLNQHCDFGPLSPILLGATAGSASWIPVYPIDTVKTLMQRSTSQSSATCLTAWQVTSQLYARGGAKAFYRGLTPKLLRSAVNHATTFTVYESAMQLMVHAQ